MSPADWLRNRAASYRQDAAFLTMRARRVQDGEKPGVSVIPGLSVDARRAVADELLDCARDFENWYPYPPIQGGSTAP